MQRIREAPTSKVVGSSLHVVSTTGVDELQIARVVIGELTSFLAVVIFMKQKRKMRKI